MARIRGRNRIRRFYTNDEGRLAQQKRLGPDLAQQKSTLIPEDKTLVDRVICILGEPTETAQRDNSGVRLECDANRGGPPVLMDCEYFKTGVRLLNPSQFDNVGGTEEGECVGECAYRIYGKET